MPWMPPSPVPSPNPRPAGAVQRVFPTVFFGFFLLVGLMVESATLHQAYRDLSTWRWPEVPAEVIASSVAKDPGHGRYAADIAYRYAQDGREIVSRKRTLQDGGSADYEAAQRLVEATVGATLRRASAR